MRVCLGGTFHPFHIGHEALLDAAIARATDLFVGVTAGTLAHRERGIPPVDVRVEAVRAYILAQGYGGGLTVRPLTTAAGPAASGPYDAIVVSPETVAGAQQINARRAEQGLQPLEIITVPHVRGSDLRIISATRIAAGDIDAKGTRRSPIRVAVGSQNPVKVAAVEAEMAALLRHPLDVQGFDVASGVPEQPRQEQTLLGARARAEAAAKAWPAADYAVGVEAGLQQMVGDRAWFDMQACVVLDGDGRATEGWGPGFQYPDWATQRALAGEMISDIIGPIARDPQIGGTTGAIGFLSRGHMDRTALTRHAVLMAMVPRLHAALYTTAPAGDAGPVRGLE